MKVKIQKLQKYLKKRGMSNDDLARAMGVSVSEIRKMLEGRTVGENTTRKFIRYFSVEEAQAMIDWEAIGRENPLACEADAEESDEDEDLDEDDELNEDSFIELFEEDYRYAYDEYDEEDLDGNI